MSSKQAVLSHLSRPPRLSLGSAHGSQACAPTPMTVGILDGEEPFAELLAEAMAACGWRLRRLGALPSRRALRHDGFAAVLVDVEIADRDALGELAGVDLCPQVAIIACTKASTVAQRVRGLEAGLDGWIEKPCSPEEVLARIQAIVRGRAFGARPVRAPVSVGELEVRHDRFDALAHGGGAELTTREFEVLALLVRNADVVVAREQIYEAVWGYEMLAGDRVVDIFVSRIRRKLRRISPSWHYVHTHPGHGYRFAARREAAEQPPDRLAVSADVRRIAPSAHQLDSALAVA